MEETLLPGRRMRRRSRECKEDEDEEERSSVSEEVKRQLWLTGPLMAGYQMQNLVQTISTMFLGHLGELPLAGASIAGSFTTVTGFSLLYGLASALDTFYGQAFGARQYHLVCIYKQRAMLILTLMSVPLAVVWFYAGSILLLLGQDEDIAMEAGRYARWLIPTLFPYGLLQCHVRFLQSQNIVFPVMMSAAATALFHFAVCWLLVHGLGLGSKGVAIGKAMSYWINVVMLAVYVRVSSTCKHTWTGFSMEAFRHKPRRAVRVVMIVAISQGLIVGVALISVRHLWGYVYSDEEEVVTYIAKMVFLLAVGNFFDGIQSVLSGVARGCGWQKIAAWINLGAYYIVGLPAAYLFAFVLRGGGMGLWMGIVFGILVQDLLLGAITLYTDWHKEATKAKNRVFSSALPTDLAT